MKHQTELATTYLLFLYLSRARIINIGRLGKFHFKKGHYIYVGSAKRNLVKRVERHLKKKKRKFWHIDYFLCYANIEEIWVTDISEEELATILSEQMIIPVLGFGSTDRKSKAHLFLSRTSFDPTRYSFKIRSFDSIHQ